MNIEEKSYGEIIVLSLEGNLTSEGDAEQFRTAIQSLMRKNARKVVVDLLKAEYISSKGLGVIMAAKGSLKTYGGELCIANTTEKTAALFRVTQLVKVLKIYESVDQAVASFK